MIPLRQLTRKGNSKFRRWCEKNDPSESLNLEVFQSESMSNLVEIDGIVIKIDESKIFSNKFELGAYLYEKLEHCPVNDRIWHFLTVVYHNQLLRKDGSIGEFNRFYLKKQLKHRHSRHLLQPVFNLYSLYHKQPELIRFLLLGPVNEAAKVFLETVQRQDLMKNENFIRVSKRIFYDEKNNILKPKISQYFLRLIALFMQYERTYDLYSMPVDRILNDLINKHPEFDRFKSGFFTKRW